MSMWLAIPLNTANRGHKSRRKSERRCQICTTKWKSKRKRCLLECSESLQRLGRDCGKERERKLSASVPFQYKGNCQFSIFLSLSLSLSQVPNWSIMNARGGLERTNFFSSTRDKFIKYFLFFRSTQNEQTCNLQFLFFFGNSYADLDLISEGEELK